MQLVPCTALQALALLALSSLSVVAALSATEPAEAFKPRTIVRRGHEGVVAGTRSRGQEDEESWEQVRSAKSEAESEEEEREAEEQEEQEEEGEEGREEEEEGDEDLVEDPDFWFLVILSTSAGFAYHKWRSTVSNLRMAGAHTTTTTTTPTWTWASAARELLPGLAQAQATAARLLAAAKTSAVGTSAATAGALEAAAAAVPVQMPELGSSTNEASALKAAPLLPCCADFSDAEKDMAPHELEWELERERETHTHATHVEVEQCTTKTFGEVGLTDL